MQYLVCNWEDVTEQQGVRRAGASRSPTPETDAGAGAGRGPRRRRWRRSCTTICSRCWRSPNSTWDCCTTASRATRRRRNWPTIWARSGKRSRNRGACRTRTQSRGPLPKRFGRDLRVAGPAGAGEARPDRTHGDPRPDRLRVRAHQGFPVPHSEFLFNAVKHAQVKDARLRLQHRRGQLWLTVADQGRGFDPQVLSQTSGFGLFSIRERVELLGGRIEIRSAQGRGTVFLIAVADGHEEEKAGREEGKKVAGPHSCTVPTLSPSPRPRGSRLHICSLTTIRSCGTA